MKKKFLPAILLMFAGLCATAGAQTAPQPHQEQLLNGLKVLVWRDTSAPKLMIKVRIHSGAAFDPKGKMGTMALLSDIIFPDPQTREYFTDDLEGGLQVTQNHDFIQITAWGKPDNDSFISMLDTLRVGLVNTPITQENFVRLRDARLAAAKLNNSDPWVVADEAVALRLLGEFPYGRPAAGNTESLARVDRFDLIAAKERFLDADNATIAIVGNIDPRFAVRAVKQLMGGWAKSDGVPAPTFAAPPAPNVNVGLVDAPGAARTEVRFAVRGLASNDKDAPALRFWAVAAEKMLTDGLPKECNTSTISEGPGITKEDLRRPVYVTSDGHILPGMVMIKTSFLAENTGRCYAPFRDAVMKVTSEGVSAAVYTETQKSIYNLVIGGQGNLDQVSDQWLNAETFKWGKFADQLALMKAATPDAGNKAAQRVFKGAPMVTVIVGDSAKIKPQLEPAAEAKP